MSTLDPHLTAPSTVRIVAMGPNDAGFGLVINTGARCFVSNHFIRQFDLSLDTVFSAQLQPNMDKEHAHRTPYEVKFVYGVQLEMDFDGPKDDADTFPVQMHPQLQALFAQVVMLEERVSELEVRHGT